MRTQAAGYTLMELMIVVAIMGILAAVIFPSFNSYIARGNRTVAKTTLNQIAAAQEGFFADRKSYAATLGTTAGTGLGFPADTFYVGKDGKPAAANSGSMIYQISMTDVVTIGVTTTSWKLVATPINAQKSKDDAPKGCGSLSLTSTGVKDRQATSTVPVSDCWTR